MYPKPKMVSVRGVGPKCRGVTHLLPARRVARSADSRPYESAHSLRATVLSGRVVQAERARRVGVSKAQDGLSPWSWSQMPRCDAGRQNCTQTGACGTCLRPSVALFRGRCALNCSQRVSNMSHMYNTKQNCQAYMVFLLEGNPLTGPRRSHLLFTPTPAYS